MSDELFAAMRQAVIDGDAAAAATLARAGAGGRRSRRSTRSRSASCPGLSYVGEQFGRASCSCRT